MQKNFKLLQLSLKRKMSLKILGKKSPGNICPGNNIAVSDCLVLDFPKIVYMTIR